MKPQQLQAGSTKVGSTLGPGMRWLGAGLALAAVLAILIAMAVSAPVAATNPAANSAANAAAQSAPDVARRVARDQQRASGQGAASKAQAVPDTANMPSNHDDPSYHSPQTSSDAVVDRSFHTPQTSNYVPVNQPARAVPNATLCDQRPDPSTCSAQTAP